MTSLVAVAIVIVAWLAWSAAERQPPQYIIMPNGDKFDFFAAVWTTNYEVPTFANRLVGHLPTGLADYLRRTLGDRIGLVPAFMPPSAYIGPAPPAGMRISPPPPPEPLLFVWLRSSSTNMATGLPSGLGGHLEDGHGWAGDTVGSASFPSAHAKWFELSFPTVPRRSTTLTLCLEDLMKPGFNSLPQYPQVGRLTFRNPGGSSFSVESR